MQPMLDTIADVVFPFYHAQDGLKIKCEGFCSSCSLQISFERKEMLKLHQYRHCMDMRGYKKCPLYDVINRQYE